jgi:flagellar biosynthesis/type III secretory pathway chaperone
MFSGNAQLKAVQHGGARQANDATQSILRQLEQVLIEENAALQSSSREDHTYFIEKKNHILRELMVLQRTSAVSAEFAANFEELKALVARNQAILETNIKAVKEVADALRSAALAEEADGTYSLDERRRGASV